MKSVLSLLDVNFMQIELLERRLNELQTEIQRDQETLKYWEDRIQLFSDDILRMVIGIPYYSKLIRVAIESIGRQAGHHV